MSIVAYTYEGGAHCPACTRLRFPSHPNDPLLRDLGYYDEHDVFKLRRDKKGDLLRRVHANDGHAPTNCKDCNQPIE